jgi:hypothetical protein
LAQTLPQADEGSTSGSRRPTNPGPYIKLENFMLRAHSRFVELDSLLDISDCEYDMVDGFDREAAIVR